MGNEYSVPGFSGYGGGLYGWTAIRLPARLHRLLSPAGLRVLDGERPATGGGALGDEGRGVRETLRLSNPVPVAVAKAAPVAVSVLGRGRLPHSSRQTHAVPGVSLLAGAGREALLLACHGEVLPRNRDRPADRDRQRAGGVWRDADGVSDDVSEPAKTWPATISAVIRMNRAENLIK